MRTVVMLLIAITPSPSLARSPISSEQLELAMRCGLAASVSGGALREFPDDEASRLRFVTLAADRLGKEPTGPVSPPSKAEFAAALGAVETLRKDFTGGSDRVQDIWLGRLHRCAPWVQANWPGPNNSSKPRPLRGSA
jgi:hypothetical protein